MTPLRIGTRGSPLALWQASHVLDLLRPHLGTRTAELVEIETAGDQSHDTPLSQIGGDGVFTKEIQRALLAGQVDVAVHSLKDLPTLEVPGLRLVAVPPRASAADVLIAREQRRFDELPLGATIATGSLRRRAQILHRRPDLHLVAIRGNVDTRLRKLTEEGLDGVVLAQAGLDRLGRSALITQVLSTEWMLPAVGQGALGLECRDADAETAHLLRRLDDPATHQAVLAERALLATLGGGCLVPIGVVAHVEDQSLSLRSAVLSPDGRERIEDRLTGPLVAAVDLGRQLAERLQRSGADRLLHP